MSIAFVIITTLLSAWPGSPKKKIFIIYEKQCTIPISITKLKTYQKKRIIVIKVNIGKKLLKPDKGLNKLKMFVFFYKELSNFKFFLNETKNIYSAPAGFCSTYKVKKQPFYRNFTSKIKRAKRVAAAFTD